MCKVIYWIIVRMKEIKGQLAKRLAENLRKRRGNTPQLQFSKKLGVSNATLNRLENEVQNVSLATLEILCKAFKCDIGDLFE